MDNHLYLQSDILEKLCLELNYSDSPSFFNLRNIDWISLYKTELGKIHWLELSKKLDAEKAFFVGDFPIALFFNFQSSDGNIEEKIYNLHLKVWNMSRPPLFFVALPEELRVYSAYQKPSPSLSEWTREERWLKRVTQITRLAEVFADYSRQEVEAERLFRKESLIEATYRADSCLLKNLKLLRQILEKLGLTRGYAHALIGRSIFIRYLEDREVLIADYFSEITNGRALNYLEILSNKNDTYNLFKKLKTDFNGDMFPMDNHEESAVKDEHIATIYAFLSGKSLAAQQELFFWAYKFDIIPTELISSIYEEFYHKKGDDTRGTHYTPGVLVEFVLSESLTTSRLARNPNVLDPACGSGIFLVEAFRRIVFYEKSKLGYMPTPGDLTSIIQKRIFGIDVNSEALRVAAFSLYLALLDFMEPADIRKNKLPKLIYDPCNVTSGKNLFLADTFCLSKDEKDILSKKILAKKQYKGKKRDEELVNRNILPIEQKFDLIVGNPPWGEAVGEDGKYALPWCEAFGYNVGDKELSQCFIWRVQNLVKPDGEIGLLVSTGVFFKHHDNSQEFRNGWLEQNSIRAVYNFAHVRDIFFRGNAKDAISPFAAVFFSPADKVTALSNKIYYASVKKNSLTEKLQAVVIDKSDCRKISQRVLRSDSNLWKVYLWGRDLDVQLLTELTTYPKLGDICTERGWTTGQGYKLSGVTTTTDALLGLPELDIGKFTRYCDIMCHPPSNLREVHRVGVVSLYRGRRILIKRGISQRYAPKGQIISRYTETPMCFRNSIHGIRLDDAEDWEIKMLLGILWSSLARYYHFLTASTWGFWHHEVHLSEHLNLPIHLQTNDTIKKRITTLVDKLSRIDELPDTILHEAYDPCERCNLEKQLDEAIFDLYELSPDQRDLICDLCNYTIDFFYNGIQSSALREPSSQELMDYVSCFKEIWDDKLKSKNAKLVECIYNPNYSGLIGVSFELKKLDYLEPEDSQGSFNSWKSLFKRLEKILPIEKSRDIFVTRVFRVVDESTLFVVKRAEKILWTKSQARHDAYEFLAEVFKREQLQERRGGN